MILERDVYVLFWFQELFLHFYIWSFMYAVLTASFMQLKLSQTKFEHQVNIISINN